MEKDEGVLTTVFMHGMLLVGKMSGGNKLNKPRAFRFFKKGEMDEETGQPFKEDSMRMSPLLFTPQFLRVGIEASSYPIPNTPANSSVFRLYAKVTDQTVGPG
jgi:hypothetical protein